MGDPAIKPTPTQDENDRTAEGEHVVDHEHDGSPYEPGGDGGGPEPPASIPVIDSIVPTSGRVPSASLDVIGKNFTPNSVVMFNRSPVTTTLVSATELNAAVSGSPGTYPVSVNDVTGESNSVDFTFTTGPPSAADEGEAQARGRRRR